MKTKTLSLYSGDRQNEKQLNPPAARYLQHSCTRPSARPCCFCRSSCPSGCSAASWLWCHRSTAPRCWAGPSNLSRGPGGCDACGRPQGHSYPRKHTQSPNEPTTNHFLNLPHVHLTPSSGDKSSVQIVTASCMNEYNLNSEGHTIYSFSFVLNSL